MRVKRLDVSDEKLDNLEMEWWNKNATLIEEIWALNLDMQNLIRLSYLRKMKKFFLANNTNDVVKILEIGCGSGWVCRLIADEKFQVIGTDFSEEQLEIAKQQALVHNKNQYCKYELADASSFSKNTDGVVIHALLHHLSARELDVFFEKLSEIKKGTKVFLYEPVFINPSKISPTFKDKFLNKVLVIIKNYALSKAKNIGKPNDDLKNGVEYLYKTARGNGWYLSPKEVPFYQDELNNYLKPLFSISKEYIVNRTDLEIAQSLILNKIEKPSFLYAKVLIPITTWLDSIATKGNFTSFIQPLQHQFVCYEMIRK